MTERKSAEADRRSISGLHSALAEHVKALRSRQGLTLRALATRAGIAHSTLSKLENGLLSPTYENLMKLAVGLGVDIVELVNPEASEKSAARRSITRRGEGPSLVVGDYQHRLVASDIIGSKLLSMVTTVKGSAHSKAPDMAAHAGEEVIHVIRGSVELHTTFYVPTVLNEGDTVYLDSRMGHSLVAHNCPEATVFWIVTGSSQESLKQSQALSGEAPGAA